MRFWVELNDHVPDGQTVTSLLRFDTKQTYSESMSGGKGVAAVTQPLLSWWETKSSFRSWYIVYAKDSCQTKEG